MKRVVSCCGRVLILQSIFRVPWWNRPLSALLFSIFALVHFSLGQIPRTPCEDFAFCSFQISDRVWFNEKHGCPVCPVPLSSCCIWFSLAVVQSRVFFGRYVALTPEIQHREKKSDFSVKLLHIHEKTRAKDAPSFSFLANSMLLGSFGHAHLFQASPSPESVFFFAGGTERPI